MARAAWIHLVAAVVWALLFIPTYLWWFDSILWVLVISLSANVIAHLAAVAAARSDNAELLHRVLVRLDSLEGAVDH